MKHEYLGDSYDMVKRLWRDVLQKWAPVYAESRFIPNEIQEDYTCLTGIQILTMMPQSAFSILNDPDTGIRLPSEKNQTEGRAHISISSIAAQLNNDLVKCVITYDQSYYRQKRRLGNDKQQRYTKMQAFREMGFQCMYYVSHVSFCFVLRTKTELAELKSILQKAGIPATRLETP